MLKTYDPKRVLISLGSHTVRGYSDGTFINIAAHGDGVTKVVGCDGEVGRSIDPDGTATITITLLQGSSTVKWCQDQYKKDKDTADALFPVLIKDLRGNFLFSAKDAWVSQMPDLEYGKEMANREIEIACGESVWD